MKLLLLRHSESVWNAQRRIHGQSDSCGLSIHGQEQARHWAMRLAPYQDIHLIWSSDLLRATQTAQLIAKQLGVPLHTSSLLREVGAGVLEGLAHEEASNMEPDSYRVWLQRADLDAIPGAEPGDSLQARVLTFLTRFASSRETGTNVVVSHAAFIRSFVNTIHGRPRSSPVPVGHEDLHIIDQPWQQLQTKSLNASWRLPVRRIETMDGIYVAKWLRGPLSSSKLAYLQLGQAIAREIGSPDPLLSYVEVFEADNPFVITIRKWVAGFHKIGQLTEREETLLCEILCRLDSALSKLSVPNNVRVVPPFSERLSKYCEKLGSDERRLLDQFLHDSRIQALVSRCEKIADFDIHRENVLFDKGDVTKIDFDSLCSGPAALPLAFALVGGFYLYQGGDLQQYLAKLSTRRWMQDELNELLILMQMRALLGIGFFRSVQQNGAHDVDTYINMYHSCLDRMRDIAKEI